MLGIREKSFCNSLLFYNLITGEMFVKRTHYLSSWSKLRVNLAVTLASEHYIRFCNFLRSCFWRTIVYICHLEQSPNPRFLVYQTKPNPKPMFRFKKKYVSNLSLSHLRQVLMCFWYKRNLFDRKVSYEKLLKINWIFSYDLIATRFNRCN